MTFSLAGAATHVIQIKDQWENRARSEEANFRTTMTPECQECPHLRKFPYPVQILIVDQWKLAAKSLADGDEPAGELPDELTCPVDYLFWRQYQLPCRHLWHYNIIFDAFQEVNWTVWVKMFEDSGFEVYETSTRLDYDYHEEVERSDRHMLQMRGVLDAIKDKYYEIAEHTANWTAKERNLQSTLRSPPWRVKASLADIIFWVQQSLIMSPPLISDVSGKLPSSPRRSNSLA